MTKLNRERLSQLQNELGPLLKRLGLRAEMMYDDDDEANIIQFVTGDRQEFASTQIFVVNSNEVGWQTCLLQTRKVDVFDVGDNGWKYFEFDWKEDDLSSDTDATLQMIATALIEGSLYWCDGHPKRSYNYHLQAIFDELKQMLSTSPMVTTPVMCSRTEAAEQLRFQDAFAHEWAVELENNTAKVMVDDEEVYTTSAHANVIVAAWIEDRLRDLSNKGFKL